MGKKCIEKCNFYIKYLDKIKCYADRPYLVFSELKPETHIYFFWPHVRNDIGNLLFLFMLLHKEQN